MKLGIVFGWSASKKMYTTQQADRPQGEMVADWDFFHSQLAHSLTRMHSREMTGDERAANFSTEGDREIERAATVFFPVAGRLAPGSPPSCG
jgi:hypothetical protein